MFDSAEKIDGIYLKTTLPNYFMGDQIYVTKLTLNCKSSVFESLSSFKTF